jgi:hypothetical protein
MDTLTTNMGHRERFATEGHSAAMKIGNSGNRSSQDISTPFHLCIRSKMLAAGLPWHLTEKDSLMTNVDAL